MARPTRFSFTPSPPAPRARDTRPKALTQRWTGSWQPTALGASAATSIRATPPRPVLRKSWPLVPEGTTDWAGVTLDVWADDPRRRRGSYGFDGLTSRSTISTQDCGRWWRNPRARAVAKPDVAGLGQQETPPLAATGKPAATFAGELEGQCGFFSTVLVPQDDRAELASVATIEADDLLALPYCLLEQPVRRARHRIVGQAALSLAAAGTGLKVSATATAARPIENEPI